MRDTESNDDGDCAFRFLHHRAGRERVTSGLRSSAIGGSYGSLNIIADAADREAFLRRCSANRPCSAVD